MNKITLENAFSDIQQYWDPLIVGGLNGQEIKLVKIKGAFTWHFHEKEDELFYVVKGAFDMEFRDRTVHLTTGELIIVPHGVEHRPNAKEEAWIMLFEPANTLNTGNIVDAFTKKELKKL